MARKNNLKTDNSGVIHFDSTTKAVMAEVSQTQENIKEKIIAVREVVLGKSNNEIILVLQYYDYNVEKAIQAYLEDGAKSALTEWHFSGPKVSNWMEKSMKDLHRQTVSLERLRLVMNEEVDKNFKRIKTVFEEVRTCLNKRESDLMVEMERVKAVANNTFASRQKTAADLKVMVDRSETMTEDELAKLRTDIKHFIGDRKIDEELSRTTRFLYDSDFLKLEVGRFGEVVPVKTVYTSHPSYVVVEPSHPEPPCVEPPRVAPVEPPPVQVSKHVGNEEVLTSEEAHDMAELQKRLKGSLKLQGLSNNNTDGSTRPTTAPVGDQLSQSNNQTSSTRDGYDSRRNRRPRPRRDGPRGGYSGEGGSRGGYHNDGGSRGGYHNDGGSRGGYHNDGGSRGGYNGEGGRRPTEYHNRGDNTVHIGRQSGGRGGRGSPRGRGGSGRPRSPRKDGPTGPKNSPSSPGNDTQRSSSRPESSTKSPTQS
ncbi:spermatogenesis-associated serine-rich protein 2-like [Argopecten irradians]|uniref:spermatogenesis-associated serine-rich protein 2-like n=1 Tax=Argopecten irradians TaxID=31199 RepID=UPI003717D463